MYNNKTLNRLDVIVLLVGLIILQILPILGSGIEKFNQAITPQSVVKEREHAVILKSTAQPIKDLTESIAMKPDDTNLYRQRAELYAKNEQWDNAINDMSIAIDKQGYNLLKGTLYAKRAKYKKSIGDYLGTIIDYETAAKVSPPAQASWYNQIGTIKMVQFKDQDGAIDAYKKALNENHQYIPSNINLAQIYDLKGDKENAIKYYKAASHYVYYEKIPDKVKEKIKARFDGNWDIDKEFIDSWFPSDGFGDDN